MDRDAIIAGVRARESEKHFVHSLGAAEMAASLARCHGIDPDLAWRAAMLHDIARDLPADEMAAVAQSYGHQISLFSRRHPQSLHAEVGALIAEHEFGLTDQDALNAIRYHFTGRPGMTVLEKIVFFSDHAEPSRPNQALMRHMYEIAKTDLDRALLRGLGALIDYQIQHDVSRDLCELSYEAFDYLLEEKQREASIAAGTARGRRVVSDPELDEAIELALSKRIDVPSVPNIRHLGGYRGYGGLTTRSGLLIRSANLSKLTESDAQVLRDEIGLRMVVDLRTAEEVKKEPNRPVAGARYMNVPLKQSIKSYMNRMDYLVERFQESESKKQRAYYLSEYARVNVIRDMYKSIATDAWSRNAIKRVFQLLLDADGPVLFNCTSGKDRTGIISAIILYTLGCDRSDIVKDYTASALPLFFDTMSYVDELKSHGYDVDLQASIQVLLGVVPGVMSTGFDYVESHYKSREHFVQEVTGMDRRAQEAFRGKYLG